MQQLSWHTEKRKIKELVPFEFNPRRLSEKQYNELKKSLTKFDLAEIPAIDTDNKIVAGHQRLKILSDIKGLEYEIDVRVPNRKLTDAEFKEYNVRSNKNTGEFDFDIFANHFDLDDLLEWGFEEKELDINLWKEEIPEEKLDEVPEPQKEAVSKLGDIFLLDGKHRVMCGDSTNGGDIALLMDGCLCDISFQSPPYNAAAEVGDGSMFGDGWKKTKNLYSDGYTDNLESSKYVDFCKEVLNNAFEYSSGFVFWNVSYNANSRFEFIKQIEDKLEYLIELISWKKSSALPIKGSFQRVVETIFVFSKDKKSIGVKEVTPNLWDVNNTNSQTKEHKACFPVALPQKAILLKDSFQKILDLFLGSGSTLIACEQTNRICYGMELDPIYIDVILRRYHNLYPDKKIECLTRGFDFNKLWQDQENK